jgi:hypothetical protein
VVERVDGVGAQRGRYLVEAVEHRDDRAVADEPAGHIRAVRGHVTQARLLQPSESPMSRRRVLCQWESG